jgi:hypothetical protein
VTAYILVQTEVGKAAQVAKDIVAIKGGLRRGREPSPLCKPAKAPMGRGTLDPQILFTDS